MKLFLAILAGGAVVFSGPFVGELRGMILAAFPEQYRLIIGGIVFVSAGAMLLAALFRIRERRAVRYGALGASALIAVAWTTAFRSGDPNVDVVETFHFVEYGLVTFLFYRVWRAKGDATTIVLPMLAGIVVGTFDEGFQWFVPERAGELRDVLLNGVAAGCGVLFGIAFEPPQSPLVVARQGTLTRLGASVAIALLIVGAFLSTVHLGYEVHDADLGVFLSPNTRSDLELLARDRAERWRGAIPFDAPRISREDHYLSEALWHVRRRNDAVDEGAFFVAWRENQIVEKYFPAVLAPPVHSDAPDLRWPPEQRADLEAKASGAAAAGFVSDAHPYPIYVWPKAVFWFVLVASAAVIAAFGVWADRRQSIHPPPTTTSSS